jgi:hypothetical protein
MGRSGVVVRRDNMALKLPLKFSTLVSAKLIPSIIMCALIFLGNPFIMKRRSTVAWVKMTALSLASTYPVLASKWL